MKNEKLRNVVLNELTEQEMRNISGGNYWALVITADGKRKLAYIRGTFPGAGVRVYL